MFPQNYVLKFCFSVSEKKKKAKFLLLSDYMPDSSPSWKKEQEQQNTLVTP
jgi:hypothetical protein